MANRSPESLAPTPPPPATEVTAAEIAEVAEMDIDALQTEMELKAADQCAEKIQAMLDGLHLAPWPADMPHQRRELVMQLLDNFTKLVPLKWHAGLAALGPNPNAIAVERLYQEIRADITQLQPNRDGQVDPRRLDIGAMALSILNHSFAGFEDPESLGRELAQNAITNAGSRDPAEVMAASLRILGMERGIDRAKYAATMSSLAKTISQSPELLPEQKSEISAIVEAFSSIAGLGTGYLDTTLRDGQIAQAKVGNAVGHAWTGAKNTASEVGAKVGLDTTTIPNPDLLSTEATASEVDEHNWAKFQVMMQEDYQARLKMFHHKMSYGTHATSGPAATELVDILGLVAVPIMPAAVLAATEGHPPLVAGAMLYTVQSISNPGVDPISELTRTAKKKIEQVGDGTEESNAENKYAENVKAVARGLPEALWREPAAVALARYLHDKESLSLADLRIFMTQQQISSPRYAELAEKNPLSASEEAQLVRLLRLSLSGEKSPAQHLAELEEMARSAAHE